MNKTQDFTKGVIWKQFTFFLFSNINWELFSTTI